MHNNITYRILRHMLLSYTNSQQAHHQCNLMTLYARVLTNVSILALIS